ncbi:glycosyltransferase [Chitinophaga sp. 212800010-3]|uniref:glycosyltransferase n=1 Tax=unclassified Chitinophaga TaxID=2619133 RepID=UPI002DE4CA04|nr:Glycosyltransferase involved in cell wall biosynthesis [Chitinophaga sp. 212800010-3]
MSKKENILFLITKSEVGGAQKYVREQVSICSSQFQVYLATNKEGWLTENASAELEGIFLDDRIESRISVSYLLGLIKYIKKHRIGLIITNSANAGLYGRIAARLTGKASIYVSHGWGSVYNGGKLAFLLNKIEHVLGKVGNKVICVSSGDYQTAIEKIGLGEHNLVLLKNCIYPFRESTAIDQGTGRKLKILSVARFSHPKRMDLLVAAMKGIDFADLYVVGGGNEEGQVKAYVEANDLKNVFLLGEIKSFDNFADYDAFILISESEGLPMSGLEAMSAGIPLILSNVGGCREIVVNNELLVENSVEDIQRAIYALKNNYRNYKAPIRPFFDANFNLSVNKDKYLSLYRSLIK